MTHFLFHNFFLHKIKDTIEKYIMTVNNIHLELHNIYSNDFEDFLLDTK